MLPMRAKTLDVEASHEAVRAQPGTALLLLIMDWKIALHPPARKPALHERSIEWLVARLERL